jgi:hypothetical protein
LPLQIKGEIEMNKRLIIIALCGMMGLVFASCSRPSIVGTWVEPAAEGSLLGEVGFTLLENGEVVSINTGFREYKTWEKVGDKLILNGVTNGTVQSSFADTNTIISLDENQLVIGQDGYSVTYQRR